MKKISAAQFKAQCLALMDDVNATGESLLITKRGKPVAKLVPIDDKKRSLLGFMEGEFKIVGDIESPAFPTESWDVISGTDPVMESNDDCKPPKSDKKH